MERITTLDEADLEESFSHASGPGGKALDIAAVMASKADIFSVGTRFDVTEAHDG